MEIANNPVLTATVSYQQFIFLTVTKLAEVTMGKITVWHFCGTDYVCYNEILLQWKTVKVY